MRLDAVLVEEVVCDLALATALDLIANAVVADMLELSRLTGLFVFRLREPFQKIKHPIGLLEVCARV